MNTLTKILGGLGVLALTVGITHICSTSKDNTANEVNRLTYYEYTQVQRRQPYVKPLATYVEENYQLDTTFMSYDRLQTYLAYKVNPAIQKVVYLYSEKDVTEPTYNAIQDKTPLLGFDSQSEDLKPLGDSIKEIGLREVTFGGEKYIAETLPVYTQDDLDRYTAETLKAEEPKQTLLDSLKSKFSKEPKQEQQAEQQVEQQTDQPQEQVELQQEELEQTEQEEQEAPEQEAPEQEAPEVQEEQPTN